MLNSALGWFGSLIEWFGQLIPKITTVRATHRGIKFVYGYKIKEVRPGIVIHWPIVTQLDILPIVRQTLNVKSQRMMTADGICISVSCVVVYRIDNVIKAIAETWDYDETIHDVAQAAVIGVLCAMTYDDILNQMHSGVIRKLTSRIRARLHPFGVATERAYLSDFAKTIVITLINGD